MNTPHGKNLIGSIYLPETIFIDPEVLSTLCEKQWMSGFAEVVKYAVTLDSHLFKTLESSQDSFVEKDPAYIKQLISRCCEIKVDIVKQDTQESGIRKVLNFGHTIAHAIEQCENYTILHGEAVVIGILVESYLSYKIAGLKEEELKRIKQLVNSYSFPLRLSKRCTKEALLEAMKYDKKSRDQEVHFVLIKHIGKVHSFDKKYSTQVRPQMIEEALEWMFEEVKVTDDNL